MSHRENMLSGFANLFAKLGAAIEKYPKMVIFISALIPILCALGIPGVELETESVYLWIPYTSSTYKNFIEFNDDYQQGAKSNFFGFILGAADGGSVMRKEILDSVLDLHVSFTTELTAPNGETFNDHCFKATVADHGFDGACQAQNILEIFEYSKLTVPTAPNDVVAFINTANTVSPVASSFGGVVIDPVSSLITSADTLVLYYSMSNDPDGTLFDFETYLVEETTPEKLTAKYPLLTSQRLSNLAFDIEVTKLVFDDMPLFVGAIFLIIIFLSLTFGKLTRSQNRILLSFVVLPQVVFSLMFATGVQGFFGMKISTLNFLIGFILAGVGVDDMIVVEEFHARAKRHGSKTVMRDTLKEAGLAIFLTSITAVVAFFVGSFVDLPAVRSFCVCAGLAFAYNFVLNVTFFPAFLFLDERRCGMTCCASRAQDEEIALAAAEEKAASKPDGEELVPVENMKAKSESSIADKFFADVLTPFLANSYSQFFVLFVVIAGALFSFVYGLDIEVGLKNTEVVPDASYAVVYFETLDEKFTSQVKRITFSVADVDYTDPAQVGNLEALFTDIEDSDLVLGKVGGFSGHWLENYQGFLEGEGLDKYADFGKRYVDFLESNGCNNASCGDAFALDVFGTINSEGELTQVMSSRFYFLDVTPSDTGNMWKTYLVLDDKRKAAGVGGYFQLDLFLFSENDSLMFAYLFRSLGATLLAVAAIMLIFTDANTTFYITLCVLCIDCHLLGLARAWDTRLNSVLFTCMIMSVGLSVDFCVHIAHEFRANTSTNPNDRLIESLTSLGPAVLKGGVTTLLGVVLLSFASSVVFRMFFKMLFLTTIFGLFHALVALPVFLTLHMKAAIYLSGGSAAVGEAQTKA